MSNILDTNLIFWIGWITLPLLFEFIPSIGNFFILIYKKIKISREEKELKFYPNITLMIPVYNSAKTLYGCIKSVNDSNYENTLIDVICVDNGSKDNSFDIFQQCQIDFPNITMNYIRSKQGKSNALNMAIFNSDGKYLINIDSDGKLEKNALKNLIIKFENHPEIDCMTGAILIDPDLVDETSHGFLRAFRKCEFVEYCQAFLCGRNFQAETNTIFTLSGAFSAFRKDTLLKTKMYNSDTICEDTQLTFQVKEELNKKVSFCEGAIFMVDPIDDLNKFYTQRQRWQIGELEVAKMFILKHMNNPFNMIKNSNVRLITQDHTSSFPRFIWYFVMFFVSLLNRNYGLLIITFSLMYLLNCISSVLYFFNILTFLKDFKELKKYYIKNFLYVLLLPIYNIFAFFVRFCGIVNSVNRKSSWKTNTFTEEKKMVKDVTQKDFEFKEKIHDFFRNLFEKECE